MSQWLLFASLVILKLVPISTDLLVSPSCDETAEICHFNLVISYNYTMTRWRVNSAGDYQSMDPVMVTENGELHVRQHCRNSPDLTATEKENVQPGDGTYKMVILFNGQLPGPPIIVYENQQVVVKVENKLVNEGTIVHWHGLRQVNTPWMDGAGTVSQCPILPGESFTYRFLADPVGTHWYHSHQASQRTMGAYGPLIVLPRNNNSNKNTSQTSKDSTPNRKQEKLMDHSRSHRKGENEKQIDHSRDHIMMISDWYKQSSVEILNQLRNEFYTYGYSNWFESDNCYIPSRNVDGVEIGMHPYYAGLINGKGYSRDSNRHPSILEIFHVNSGEWHCFRVINVGMFYFLRVSVDHHDLYVTSTEGDDLQQVKVESVIVGPGERYDFLIFANDPLEIGSYVIRVETTEYYYNTTHMAPHSVTGILHYKGSEIQPNATERQKCTAERKCRILNCPFRSYREEDQIDCIPITELTSKQKRSEINHENEEVMEIFMRLQFTGADYFGAFKPTINGILHRPHTVPPQIYPPEGTNSICKEPDDCPNDACHCTHELHAPLGQIVQLVVFTHLPPFSVQSVLGTAHTLHLHGYQFEVTKIGWPNYSDNGYFSKNTVDITCDDNDKDHGWTCHEPRWTNSSWSKMSHRDPQSPPKPRKDTVLVPAGGYVVLRFRADNPGYWLMHCHMEIHNEMGMTMVLRTGNESQMAKLPKHFPSCGNFHWSEEEFNELLKDDPKGTQSYFHINSLPPQVTGRIAVVFVIAVAIILIIIWISYLPSVRTKFQMKLPFSMSCMDEPFSPVIRHSTSSENAPFCSTAT